MTLIIFLFAFVFSFLGTELPTLPACTSDDGSGPTPCYWDAEVQGNGQGIDFWTDAEGNIFY